MIRLLDWTSRLSRWLAWIGGAALLLSAVCISLDVVFRALWKVTYFESFELSGYAFAIATAMGMSWALISRAHIRIEVLYTRLSLKTRAWLDVWAYAGLAAVTVVLVYWCVQTVWGNYDSGARSNTSLALPLYWPQLLWLIGLVWVACVTVIYTLHGLRSCLAGRHAEGNRVLGISTVEDEIAAETRKEPA